ncbi:hypothetical protein [Streptomyces lavendulae]
MLLGYERCTTEARQLSATSWTRRDIIDVRDVTGDGIPDLYLTRNDGTLHLCYGGRTTIGNGQRVEEDDWATARTLG